MREVRDLIGSQRAASAGMVGPAEDSGLEEGAVDDQLTATFKQVEQSHFALRSHELVLFLYGHPWHPTALGGHCVTCAGEGLLLYEKLLARGFPLLRRDNRGSLHLGFLVLHASLL